MWNGNLESPQIAETILTESVIVFISPDMPFSRVQLQVSFPPRGLWQVGGYFL
jgi:hypothetical protein